ncbi:MAG: hypothetical protein NT169_11895 [Chloroflexi bacterium]|nr:hypothetical protein [Chloroflexota bacterium]
MQIETEVRLPSSKLAQPKPVEREDLFKKRLLKIGLLREVKTPYLVASTDNRAPIQVAGEPLSRAIIEERC